MKLLFHVQNFLKSFSYEHYLKELSELERIYNIWVGFYIINQILMNSHEAKHCLCFHKIHIFDSCHIEHPLERNQHEVVWRSFSGESHKFFEYIATYISIILWTIQKENLSTFGVDSNLIESPFFLKNKTRHALCCCIYSRCIRLSIKQSIWRVINEIVGKKNGYFFEKCCIFLAFSRTFWSSFTKRCEYADTIKFTFDLLWTAFYFDREMIQNLRRVKSSINRVLCTFLAFIFEFTYLRYNLYQIFNYFILVLLINSLSNQIDTTFFNLKN